MSHYRALPRYFLATWQLALDCWAGKEPPGIGEHRSWTPSGTPQPTDLMFVVMYGAHDAPHPAWHEIPHVLDVTSFQAHTAAQPAGWAYSSHLASAAAKAAAVKIAAPVGGVSVPAVAPAFSWDVSDQTGQVINQLVVLPTDSTFQLAMKLHQFYQHFRP